MQDALLKYGLSGIVLAASWWAIVRLMKIIERIEERHRKERDEWRDDARRSQDEARRVQEDNTKVIRDTGNILSGIKSLLENKYR